MSAVTKAMDIEDSVQM